MKLAPAICFVIGSCLILTSSEVLAQRRLPNGQRVRQAAKVTSLAAAVEPQKTTSTPAPAGPAPTTTLVTSVPVAPISAPPTTPTAPVATASMVSPQVIRIEVTVPPGTTLAPDPKNNEKKPPPCTGLEDGHDWVARTDRAATVLRELLDATDRGMSLGMLNRSDCVAVVPSLKKAGFTIGGQWGRGVLSCRYDNKSWSPPVFFTMTGGSFGLQIGVQFTDLVMLIGNRSGADSLLQNKLEVGASASGTALMMGRHAGVSSDVLMNSRVISYARSRGLFAGVELKGAYFRPDNMAHHVVYGNDAHVHDILSSERIANEARATCYGGINALSRTLREISPTHVYYAKVPRPRYSSAPPASAPAAR
ncbi:MAG: hypothetical protein JST84_07700 [Acidobacteria bacterium]|nr:hypothetical protein [Acidobacteriota bacterium]